MTDLAIKTYQTILDQKNKNKKDSKIIDMKINLSKELQTRLISNAIQKREAIQKEDGSKEFIQKEFEIYNALELIPTADEKKLKEIGSLINQTEKKK